MATQHKS